MRSSDFLGKLAVEGKLILVEPSKEISESYLVKSSNCLKSSKILFENGLYENCVSEAYYAMYNSAISLFFMCGIKCESHAGAVLLLKTAFQDEYLYTELGKAKKERIDKQYYVVELDMKPITQELAQDMIKSADRFVLSARSLLGKIGSYEVDRIRKRIRM
jgi:uncharacterized protein (UPF0332 family)